MPHSRSARAGQGRASPRSNISTPPASGSRLSRGLDALGPPLNPCWASTEECRLSQGSTARASSPFKGNLVMLQSAYMPRSLHTAKRSSPTSSTPTTSSAPSSRTPYDLKLSLSFRTSPHEPIRQFSSLQTPCFRRPCHTTSFHRWHQAVAVGLPQ